MQESVSSSPIVTVAITGPSGSGKSTLSDVLAKCLGSASVTVHQDHFFLGPKPKSYWDQIEQGENKDHPGAVNWPALREAFASAVASLREKSETGRPKILLIEGFLLLQDVEIMSYVDAVVFLSTDCETCLNRRLARSKRTEHESEGCRVYYSKFVWPGFLQYTQPELDRLKARSASESADETTAAAAAATKKPALYELDGTATMTSVAEQALREVLGFLEVSGAGTVDVGDSIASTVAAALAPSEPVPK